MDELLTYQAQNNQTKNIEVLPGRTDPLGATVATDGVNFSLFSHNAEAIELLLFDSPNAAKPAQIIKLNKTCQYWHVFVQGIKAGQIYAYRAYGQFAPERGDRFDHDKVLLDPYARAIVNMENYDRDAASLPGDNCAQALKGVVVDSSTYDWEGDTHPRIPYATSVIYEMHVGGFTNNPNSEVSPKKRGTYAGIIEKIPYLKELGITAVELLPVHQFDPQDVRPGLTNYWGYSTVGFFAPHSGYSSRRDPLGVVDEFRDLVKALHKAGIEVILDVVFNHTAEGNHQGPTLSYRGLDNRTYYMLEDDPTYYKNFTGCGNSFQGNHPIPGRLIMDSLRYWVKEMHVDGFRFDLAATMARNISGQVIKVESGELNIIWAIESDPLLAGTKLIAEAWDAAGLYGVGQFVALADWFAEWNGPFRDDVRRFVKGDLGSVNALAARIIASPDIYSRRDTDINRSVNFVTCHDGFTLNDLVSYDRKHNLANGEENCDGANDNFSWNCGVEGDCPDSEIEQLRSRQIKNFFSILLFSQGTPMFLMGDEVRRSQQGNNNAYCQDNELSWLDWSLTKTNKGLLRFVGKLIHFIQGLEVFRLEEFLEVGFTSEKPHLIWHGTYLGQPDWGKDSHVLAFSLKEPTSGEHLHVMFNAYWYPLNFELPPLAPGNHWHRIVDTALPAPDDFTDLATAPQISQDNYLVTARSVVVLMEKPN
ncbi:MAG: glycogen debranching protein GlgX [Prochloraceae cyanobacterium]